MDLRVKVRDYHVLFSFKGNRLPDNILNFNKYQFNQRYIKGYNILELRLSNKQPYLFKLINTLTGTVSSLVQHLGNMEAGDKTNIEKVLLVIYKLE